MSWFQQLKQVFSGKRPPPPGSAPAEDRGGKRRAAAQPSDDEIAAIPDLVERATAHYNRAIVYQNEEANLDRAIAHYSAMLKLVPKFVKAYVNRGVCFLGLATPDHDAAIADFDRSCALLAAGTDRAMAGYANRANAYELAGDLDSALEDYERAAAMAPSFSGARQGVERVREKIAARSAPPERRARSAESYQAEGWKRKADGDPVGALAAFHRAVDLGTSPDALYGRGVMNCILHRYVDAIADLDRAIDLHPRFPAALTERGLAHVESGDIDRGIQDYDAALALDPAEPIAHFNKGTALCLQSRWAEAIAWLNLALQIDPTNVEPHYNRSAAYEMSGELAPAMRDLEAYLHVVTEGPNVPHARARLAKLRARIGRTESAAPEAALTQLWTQVVSVGLDRTVAELACDVREQGAFFAIVELGDGRRAVAPVYGRNGLRRRLTEIADRIGEPILGLRLGQLHDLWTECTPVAPTTDRELTWRRLVESGGHTVMLDGERIVGVLSQRQLTARDYPHLPTQVFGPAPLFERRSEGPQARHCPACHAAIAYFEPVLRDGMLDDYACGACGASPVERWIEQRMHPGDWSRHGFLGEDERLDERIAADARTLERLGLSHDQIADALGRLLDAASAACEDRIAEATVQFEDAMRAAGQRGLEGEAFLPLGPALDEIEQRLQRGELPAPSDGATIGRHQVFLQVYLGYQHCPWTILHRPWSDEPPPLPIVVRRVGNFIHQTAKAGCSLTCRTGLDYRHGERDFLIVDRDTGRYLRGSGLLVHLIREHRFFEGAACRYRLDPEQAAQVLGLG